MCALYQLFSRNGPAHADKNGPNQIIGFVKMGQKYLRTTKKWVIWIENQGFFF